jgi:general secretion pathway protein E
MLNQPTDTSGLLSIDEPSSARLYRLPELGMDPLSLARFRNAISVEHGLILVTGPTGSGKSTTLYSALQELDTKERNAVTLVFGDS